MGDYHFLLCILLQSGYIFYDQEIKSHHVKDCCKFSFWQQAVNPLPFSSRSLRSMGSLKRTFTKSTRNANEGKCPAQLSLLTPPPHPCVFPSKALAQGAPSRSTLPGRSLWFMAELCLYLALWRGGGEVELGWRTCVQAKAARRDQTLVTVGKEREAQGHVSEVTQVTPALDRNGDDDRDYHLLDHLPAASRILG